VNALSVHQTTASPARKPYGLLAEFESAEIVIRAAEKVRARGFVLWDVFGPCPLPELEKTIKPGGSPVGWFTLGGAAAGFLGGMLLVWLVNQVDYPIPVGGKPYFSAWTAFLPAFELAVLGGAAATLLGMLFLSGLPQWRHALLRNRRFSLATHDRFFLVLECADPQFHEVEARQFLESLGGKRLELLEE
jgi:hypothetical protein